MGNISLEVTLIFLLVVANGVFSMAELAVVSARKSKLRHLSEQGRKGAAAALHLAVNPHDFLSTVQVGITLVGTLAGAFGGATIAGRLAVYLQQFPAVAAYSETIAISVVVLAISYVTLILGELVPKHVALSNPEAIASVVAPPMRMLARLGAPAVRFLTISTKAVLKILPVRETRETAVTEDEIKVMIAEGTARGTFQEAEREMVEGVFRLGDRRVVDLMQPRGQMEFLDATDPWDVSLQTLRRTAYSRFPVVDGEPDRVLGVIHVKDLFLASTNGHPIDLRALAKKPLFVPEMAPALEVLDLFRESGQQLALIVDEHGGIQGLVTLTDLMEAVMGELRGPGETSRPRIVKREDGSWLADGSLPIATLLEELGIAEVPGGPGSFSTVGGLILTHLRRIPSPGDYVIAGEWRFEVLDMDANRIDKVLVSRALE